MAPAVSQEIKDILNPFCKALHEEYEETKNCLTEGRYDFSFNSRFIAENAAVIHTMIRRILPGMGCYSGGRSDTTERSHTFRVMSTSPLYILCSEIILRNGKKLSIVGEPSIIDGKVQVISSV